MRQVAIHFNSCRFDIIAVFDDVREFPKYEKIWKEIFQIR